MLSTHDERFFEAVQHLTVVETLLEAALQKNGRVRESLWAIAWNLDSALVQELIKQDKYAALGSMTQRLFQGVEPPSDEVRQAALQVHRDRLQTDYLERRGKS
ncbi:hypothetical protein [Nannocystis bainbridge]|uniref:Uncharacterized protein n=1 Tax=Nannocystis bainbridge TaxID=2995303 RepID=A0ABT5E273_9BACT|nr:hypothetical protein [Nannocystis bainbridge]MDC0719944.1 hypothetical protein [Nannocystis bainbridge]